MTTYKKINPIERTGGEALDELKIKVTYDKGGYNTKRGIHAYITPVHRTNRDGFCVESCTLLGDSRECGFRVCLRELGRKSQKVEDEIANKVEQLADEIVSRWDKGERQTLAIFIMNAVK
jgi:hypothetical protein